MSIALSAKPTELMAQHLSVLRAYARQVIVQEEPLILCEQQDKCMRLQQFVAIGASYKCTEKELVGLLYKGIFQ